MFQTLGNLTVDPRAGLLLVNWGTGGTLQITGRAQIRWDTGGSWPGAERLVVFTVEGVLERERVLPQHWHLIEPFNRNPPLGNLAADIALTVADPRLRLALPRQ
jgi:hypothetical protein